MGFSIFGLLFSRQKTRYIVYVCFCAQAQRCLQCAKNECDHIDTYYVNVCKIEIVDALLHLTTHAMHEARLRPYVVL